jgi:hypothetical protein
MIVIAVKNEIKNQTQTKALFPNGLDAFLDNDKTNRIFFEKKRVLKIIFEHWFQKKKPLTKEDMVKDILGFYFPGRPDMNKYRKPYKNNPNYHEMNWDKYFIAEKKAAEKYIDKFMKKNKDMVLYKVDVNDLWLDMWGINKQKLIDNFNRMILGEFVYYV